MSAPSLDLAPLRALGACDGSDSALEWLEQGGFATLQDAWDACTRADWMLWYAARVAGGDPGSAARWQLVDCLWAAVHPEIKPTWTAWEADPRCPVRDRRLLDRLQSAIASRDLAAVQAVSAASTQAAVVAGGVLAPWWVAVRAAWVAWAASAQEAAPRVASAAWTAHAPSPAYMTAVVRTRYPAPPPLPTPEARP